MEKKNFQKKKKEEKKKSRANTLAGLNGESRRGDKWRREEEERRHLYIEKKGVFGFCGRLGGALFLYLMNFILFYLFIRFFFPFFFACVKNEARLKIGRNRGRKKKTETKRE